MYKKKLTSIGLPGEPVHRLEQAGLENRCLQHEVNQIKEMLRIANCEKAALNDQNNSKKHHIKGANKKTRNAKVGPITEMAKAKDAVHNKKQHPESERKTKDERNKALADLQKEGKINHEFRAQLKIEQSRLPHICETTQNAAEVMVVVAIQFNVLRTDFRHLQGVLKRNQIGLPETFKRIYDEWKKSRDRNTALFAPFYAVHDE